jgi:hypothetical protein
VVERNVVVVLDKELDERVVVGGGVGFEDDVGELGACDADVELMGVTAVPVVLLDLDVDEEGTDGATLEELAGRIRRCSNPCRTRG